jgi:colicin import membrane protein
MNVILEETDLKKDIVKFEKSATEILVQNAEDVEFAQNTIIVAQQFKKDINAYWEEPIRKAHEAHKELTKKRAEMLKPVEDREKDLRAKINRYLTEQERRRQEEQRKLDEERRKKEQAEREKLARQAEKAREKGNEEKAEVLQERAENVFIPPAIVVPEIEKTNKTDAGTMSQRKDISVKITDPLQVIKAVAEGRLPIGIININETKLKQAVKLAGITQMAGCVIEEVITAQFRSA